jgi:hypothetical protein
MVAPFWSPSLRAVVKGATVPSYLPFDILRFPPNRTPRLSQLY